MAEEKRNFLSSKAIRILLITFGLLIVLDYLVFSLIAYMDALHEVLQISSLEVWLSVSFGLVLFAARILLFCMAAGREKEEKSYLIGTWIHQGVCALLCAVSLFVLTGFSKGQYARETIVYFTEFKLILAFLAIMQGMIQRIFHNGCVLERKISQGVPVRVWAYVFRIIFYVVIAGKTLDLDWYWCRKWIHMLMEIIGT